MKKHPLRKVVLGAASWLALSALLPTAPALAQRPAFDEAFVCGTALPNTYAAGPAQVVDDAAGNRYVCGNFNGTTLLGSNLFTAPPDPATGTPWLDAYVAKFDAAGACLWATQIGGTAWDDATALAVDAAGEVFVTGGYYSYSIRVGVGGPTLYNSSAAKDVFVARLAGATGQCVWARRAGGTGEDAPEALALDGRGHLFVGGRGNSNPADLGPFRLGRTWAEGGPGNSFLARLDAASGQWQWAQRLGGTGLNYVVTEPGSGDLLVGGHIARDSCRFGNTVLAVYPPPVYYHRQPSDFFVGRVSGAGVWRWTVQGNAATQQNHAGIGGLAYDGIGHIYLAGGYTGASARIGPATLPNRSALVPAGGGYFTHLSDAFMARLDALTGQWQWVTSEGGPGGDTAGPIVANGQGLVMVSTNEMSVNYLNYYPSLRRIVPTTGATVWTDPINFRNMTLSNGGKVYTWSGFGTSTWSLDALTLTGINPPDVTYYVARLGATVLAAHSVTSPAAIGLNAWPNPTGATGTVQVTGAAPGQTLTLFDVLGRPVAHNTMPARGPLSWALPAGIAPGLYVLRASKQATRLVLE